MNTKLEEISLQRKRAHTKLLANSSKIYDCFLTMERLAYADGALSKKHKELIGLGIALVQACESAMQWHVEQARIAGASFEELLETIEVAIEMGGGPAVVASRFALEVMESIGVKPSR
ncbi:MAG: carboxymuconolactone decarboxylase family protein [Acidobacteriaceae bacterium]|jgi:AhpD family alkylhydroperoxidase